MSVAAPVQQSARSPQKTGPSTTVVDNLASVGYRVMAKVGQGTAGAVYVALDKHGKRVAVKVLHAKLAQDDVAVQRFLREAGLAMRLQHENLVRALDCGETEGTLYLVMEFAEGETLANRLIKEGRVPEPDAVKIALALADVLQMAHEQQLIHRDLKPANVMIAGDGTPKLGDFGLVKDLAGEDLTKPNQGLGTPIYMAPEQFIDAKRVDCRTDIYALGVLLYHMVTGELPFPGPGLTQILDAKMRGEYRAPERLAPTLRPETVAAIKQSLQPKAEKRPASMMEFARLLLGADAPAPVAPVAVAAAVASADSTVPEVRLAPIEESFHDLAPIAAAAPHAARPATPAPVAAALRPAAPPNSTTRGPSSVSVAIQGATPPAAAAPAAAAPAVPDEWYVVLSHGRRLMLSKLGTRSIQKAIIRGTLPIHVCAGRTPKGPFLPIGLIPELKLPEESEPSAPAQ